MNYVIIGKIVNTFGIRGELKCEVYTDFVKERFQKGSFIYLGPKHQKETVEKVKNHKGFLLLSLDGKPDINLVEGYKGLDIYKDEADIPPLKEGEYFFRDLIGLKVLVAAEEKGQVIAVESGQPANYLRIRTLSGAETLVPFLPVFVEQVDLKEKTIRIVEMDGLL